VLISVIGAGYVGLVTAACLAKLGNAVRVLDVDEDRIRRLRRGELPIREPGLDELVSVATSGGRLEFDSDPRCIRGTALAIVAVGTLDGDGEWTDVFVRATVDAVARDAGAPRSIVIRSTLLPGTAVGIARSTRAVAPQVEIAFNPEFTREGTAVADFLAPDRVVIGLGEPGTAATPTSATLAERVHALYAPLGVPIVVTDLTSAEMIKVASNVFLAAKITYANELARLCAATGADVAAVVDGVGLDKRIGRAFMSPGPGFGGSCLPSQARALPALARQLAVRTELIDAITRSNDDQSAWFLDRLEDLSGETLSGRHVALLGLTFKAGTDDLRESPALRLAMRLVRRGASVAAFDPVATDAAVAVLADQGVSVEPCPDAIEAARGADLVIVATEWREFRQLDWMALAAVMRGRLVGGARHAVDVAAASEAGLSVVDMGVLVRPLEVMTAAPSADRSAAASSAAGP
jgi:UDPglucose 6-dehydrogenase